MGGVTKPDYSRQARRFLKWRGKKYPPRILQAASMAEQTSTRTGASGTKYTYYVYPRGTPVDKGKDGNYVHTKINSDNKWVPVYFGEGDLSDRAGKNHHQSDCIDS